MDTDFGEYCINRELNRGATAVVYEAEDTNASAWDSAHSRVALKVFNERPGGGYTIPISTIHQEIKCASSLQHDNIAQLLNVVPHGDRLGLAFELIQGPDLLDYIKKFRSRVPEELAIYYFRQMVSAVQYIHERETVHRDLKPENCMVDPETHTLKVIDFGLAVSTSAQCLTGCGTINTIAPECIAVNNLPAVIEHPESVDIWGLGVTLYIMLSGSYPFQDGQRPHCDEALKRNILRGRPHALPGRISSATRDLVRNILQVDPERRLTLSEILEHSALRIGTPSQSIFDQEARLFSESQGMGSRASSCISQTTDISSDRTRLQSPWLTQDSSCEMDCEMSESPAPTPSADTGGHFAPNSSKMQVAGSSARATLTPAFGGSTSLTMSRDWGSLGSLSSRWSPSALQPSLLLNTAMPSQNSLRLLKPCSSPQSPVSVGNFPSHSSYASSSKSSTSLASQLEMIQTALQDESERAGLEGSRVQRWDDSDDDQADTEFGSEFDMGDKAQIFYAIPAPQMTSCSPVKVHRSDDSALGFDSSCSLPRSPKDAPTGHTPIRLFSVSDSDLTFGDPTPSQQPLTGGQGLGKLKAVPSFQQISPFKSYLSGIPEEEVDELLDEEYDSDLTRNQSLGVFNLSLQSDTTTYDD